FGWQSLLCLAMMAPAISGSTDAQSNLRKADEALLGLKPKRATKYYARVAKLGRVRAFILSGYAEYGEARAYAERLRYRSALKHLKTCLQFPISLSGFER